MKTIKSIGVWKVMRDDEDKVMGLIADAETHRGVPVQVQVEWKVDVDVESETGLVDVGVWDGDHGSLDSSCVAIPMNADSNVIHCAVLVGLALVGLENVAPIAQKTARAVEVAIGKAPAYESLPASDWRFCPTCGKPFVTIPQALIRTKIDGQYYYGGEDVCWGRGDCAKRIVADELARREAPRECSCTTPYQADPVCRVCGGRTKPLTPSANANGSAEPTS